MPRSAAFVTAVCLCISPITRAGHELPPAARDQAPPPVPAGASWTIVKRTDPHHIVALFEGGELFVRQAEFEAAAVRTGATQLMDVPDHLVEKVIRGRVHIGDAWTIDAGRHGQFHFRVERLVLGYKDCGEGWGLVAGVAANEAARFAQVPEEYFVARRDRLTSPAPSVTRIGAITLTLTAANRYALTTLLEIERQRAWPAIHRQAEEAYAGSNDSLNVRRWRALDARFDLGEAVLDYNFQAFRMTPDGDPRLFVRATWKIERTVVYAMSAWVRVSSALSVDDSDASVTIRLRYGSESVGNPWNDDFLGTILNVFDTDGDGRGEILMSVSGYESRDMEVFVYPVAPGRAHVTIATYGDGC